MARAMGIAIGMGALVVGTAVMVSASRSQSPEERQAKEAFTQEKIQAEQKEEALKAKVDREKDALKDQTEYRQAQLDEYARAQEEKIDQNLDAAKTQLNERQDALGQAAEAPGAQELSGMVTEVNPLTRTVAIRPAAASGVSVIPSGTPATTQLKVGEDAAILLGGQRLSFSDVRVGDRVNIKLHEDMGQRMVHSIMIHPRATP